MRDLRIYDGYRQAEREIRRWGFMGAHDAGMFSIPINGVQLNVIATAGSFWDHVSISRPDRTPTWAEMDEIKRMFFEDHEVAMQVHPAITNHVNIHPNCLHLWRPWPQIGHIPLPPLEFV